MVYKYSTTTRNKQSKGTPTVTTNTTAGNASPPPLECHYTRALRRMDFMAKFGKLTEGVCSDCQLPATRRYAARRCAY